MLLRSSVFLKAQKIRYDATSGLANKTFAKLKTVRTCLWFSMESYEGLDHCFTTESILLHKLNQ